MIHVTHRIADLIPTRSAVDRVISALVIEHGIATIDYDAELEDFEYLAEKHKGNEVLAMLHLIHASLNYAMESNTISCVELHLCEVMFQEICPEFVAD